MFENTLFLALPVPVLPVGTLVVLFLAPAEPQAQLCAPFVPVQVERNQRVALALDGARESIQFVAV